MPPKRFNKKRRNYKKRKNGPRLKARTLSLGPRMPPSIIAKHKFNYSGTLTQPANVTTLNGSAIASFRMNSLRDPERAGLSSDPANFFDDMAHFYNTYRVLGAKAYIKFINLTAEPIHIVTHIGVDQVASGANLDLIAWKNMANTTNSMVHGVNTGAKSVRNLSVGYSPEKVEGKKKSLNRADNRLESLTSADPLQQHHLTIGATQVNTSFDSVAMNVHYEITILYTALWNDRKNNYPQGGQ